MKIKDIFCDAATVAGCCVGVGFLSGKEAQIYFGNVVNLVIFCLLFVLATIIIRLYCAKKGAFDVAGLSKSCFGKMSTPFIVLFLLCSFVSTATALAGLENCLQTFFALPQPLYAVVASAFSVLILKKGLKTVKTLNAVAICLALVYLATLAIFTPKTTATLQISPLQPAKYALFSVTMSLGILTPLSDTTKKANLLSAILATGILAVLILAVLYIADFSLELPLFGKTDNLYINVLGSICLTMATVTGVVANVYPIVQNVKDIFADEGLCLATVFCAAVGFSMFGFDFALHYGYIFVASVGCLLITAILLDRVSKQKNYPKLGVAVK